MTDQHHIIKRQILELELPSQKTAFEIQNEVSRVYSRRVIPVIEACLDKLSAAGEISRADSLELDIGRIAREDLEEEFPLRVEEHLLELLEETLGHPDSPCLPSRTREADIDSERQRQRSGPTEGFRQRGLSGTSAGDFQRGFHRVSEAASRLELFEYFIHNGSLPWWANIAGIKELEDDIRQIALDSPDELAAIITRIIPHERKLRRLIYQFSDRFLLSLARLLLRQSDSLYPFLIDFTSMFLEKDVIEKYPRNRARLTLWLELFSTMRSTSQLQPDVTWSAADLLQRLSLQLGTGYRQLVEILVEAAEQLKKDGHSFRSDLPGLLGKLTSGPDQAPFNPEYGPSATIPASLYPDIGIETMPEELALSPQSTEDMLMRLEQASRVFSALEISGARLESLRAFQRLLAISPQKALRKSEGPEGGKVSESGEARHISRDVPGQQSPGNEEKGEPSDSPGEPLPSIESVTNTRQSESSAGPGKDTFEEPQPAGERDSQPDAPLAGGESEGRKADGESETSSTQDFPELQYSEVLHPLWGKEVAAPAGGQSQSVPFAEEKGPSGEPGSPPAVSTAELYRDIDELLTFLEKQLLSSRITPKTASKLIPPVRSLAGHISPPGLEGRRRNLEQMLQKLVTSSQDSGRIQERSRSQILTEEEPDSADEMYLRNAGLVILWPFLGNFFDSLGLVREGSFVDVPAMERAVHLLQYLVDGGTETPEYELVLNKVLCGLDPAHPVPLFLEISEEESTEAEDLLQAVILNWPALGTVSIDGFRGAFLQRQGVLSQQYGEWLVRVERQTHDILLDKLDWTISVIRLPWLDSLISVEW